MSLQKSEVHFTQQAFLCQSIPVDLQGNRLNKLLIFVYFSESKGVEYAFFGDIACMSYTFQSRPTPDFLSHFESMENPHQQAKIFYPLDEIILLVLCAVIPAAQTWTSIAL